MPMQGGTTYHFVTEGLEAALEMIFPGAEVRPAANHLLPCSLPISRNSTRAAILPPDPASNAKTTIDCQPDPQLRHDNIRACVAQRNGPTVALSRTNGS